MKMRKLLAFVALLVGVVLASMPLITGDRDIEVAQHHLDHAVLMLFGIIAGLAFAQSDPEREAPPWIWVTVFCPVIAMMLMSPSLYARVDQVPWLHTIDHLVFVMLAALTAYSGQMYVRGIGWASAILLEAMAVAAMFGYGVAPAGAAAAQTGATTTVTQTAHFPGDPVHGKTVFTQFCAVCHGADGSGGQGPSLKGELSRKDFPHLKSWIEHPAPPMPMLYPMPLREKDVNDVAAYVATLH